MTINTRDSQFSSPDYVLAEFHKFGINLRKVDDEHVQIAFNETTTMYDLDEVIEIFAEVKGKRSVIGNYMSDHFYLDKSYKDLNPSL